jgi:hypothetical protein
MTPKDAFTDATLCPVCHTESCENPKHVPPADDTPTDADTGTQTDRPTVSFHHADDVIGALRPEEIVEGIAWAGCVSVVVSESGAGKTFVLNDLSSAVSSNVQWHGRDVRHGSVAYLSFEGDALGVRLRALLTQGRHVEHVYVLHGQAPLSPRTLRDSDETPSIGERTVTAALEALVAELAAANRPPIRLIVIDTVRASMVGSEDNSDHTSAYLRAVRRIMASVPGAATVLAHHAGWQDGEVKKKRERGSSAWRGNSDATLYLEAGETDAERGETELTLRTLKVRDAERPAPLHLIRRRVELPEAIGDDLRRGPVTSCVIDRDMRTREDREAAQAQATDAAHYDADLKMLRQLTTQRMTSQDQLRVALAWKRDLVGETLARLIQRGWVLPPEKQRRPFVVTPAGVAALP